MLTVDIATLTAALDHWRNAFADPLSWRTVADRAGCAPSTFTRMRAGSTPSAEVLLTLCDLMGADLVDFVVPPPSSRGRLQRATDSGGDGGDFRDGDDDGGMTTTPLRVIGTIVVEGEPTGDGRMIEQGALEWGDALPIPIIWDREDGDHTGAVVGSITAISREAGGAIVGEGVLSASDDGEASAAVQRVAELLAEGAVGVSVALDRVEEEIRVDADLLREEGVDDDPEDAVQPEVDDEKVDGDGRVKIAEIAYDDMLFVTTAARIRHVAIVDTPAFAQARLAIDDPEGATVSVAACGTLALADPDAWEGRREWFADPAFGTPGRDDRLRYDPHTGRWSCPPTVTPDGQVYGHIAPFGICLRGRPDRCVTPPRSDLRGFMRGAAPAAGGLATGVIVAGDHASVGVGAEAATRHYDKTGRAIADVTVGEDAHGVWFAGMVRPGALAEDVYALQSADVSGHWEPGKDGRMTLVGLPAVNVGGFPKGYLTWEEVSGGLAASAELDDDDDCGCSEASLEQVDDGITGALMRIEEALSRVATAVAPAYAAHLSDLADG